MSAVVGLFAVLFGLGDQALAALAGVAQTASLNGTLMGYLDGYVQGSILWGANTSVGALDALSNAFAAVGGLFEVLLGML